jgi:hypothetical protein
MRIKHSQIRALIKFAGVVVFSFSLYKKLKQIFLYGGATQEKHVEHDDSETVLSYVDAQPMSASYSYLEVGDSEESVDEWICEDEDYNETKGG